MIRDAVLALGLRVVGTLLWLGYILVLAHLLDPEGFGLVLYALNFLLIATPIACLGFETATMRFGARYWQAGDSLAFAALVRHARRFALLGGVLCLLALMLATAARLDTPITDNWTLAAIVGVCIPLSAAMTIHRDGLHAAGKLVMAHTGFTVTRALLPLIGSLALGMLGLLTPVGALSLYAASLGLSLVVEAWQVSRLVRNRPPTGQPKAYARQHLMAALGAWPGEVTWVLIVRATGLVLGLVLGLQAAALFLLAQRICALSQFLADAVRTAAAPEIARAAAHADRSALQGSVSRASALTFVVDGVAKLCLIAIGWPILHLFGDTYLSAYPIVVILILGELNRAFLGSPALVMTMAGLQKERSVATALAAGVMIGSSWLGAIWFGPIGAAIAYGLTIWTLNGWLAWRTYRRLGIKCGLFGITKASIVDIVSAYGPLKSSRPRFGGSR